MTDTTLATEVGFTLGETQCCGLACDGGACETCPCCSAGWCVWGHDGIPEEPADYAAWLDVAADYNPLAARLRQVELSPEELTMVYRAVRLKLQRVRGDMARDRRKGDLFHAQAKARRRFDYASLLLRLDGLVPEEDR